MNNDLEARLQALENDVKRKGVPDYSLPGRVIALEKQSAMLLHWADSHNKRLKVLEQLIDDFLESRYRMREDIVALQHAATETARELQMLRPQVADPVLPVPDMGGVAEAGCPITDSLRTTCPHTLDQTIPGSPFLRFGKCGMVFLPIKEALSALFDDGAMLVNEKEGGGVASAQEEPFLLDNTSVVRVMDYGIYRVTRLSGGDKCWDVHFEREADNA